MTPVRIIVNFLNCSSSSSSLTSTPTPAHGYGCTRTRVGESASAKLLRRRHQQQPTTRIRPIIPVNITRNSMLGVPPVLQPTTLSDIVSTGRMNNRGKETPRPRPSTAPAETSEEKVVCTCERSVIKAHVTGAFSRSSSTLAFMEGESFSGTQRPETVYTALICMYNSWKPQIVDLGDVL